jgi:hypothetical protein
VTLSEEDLAKVISGQSLGDPASLTFRDPASFRAGELHAHTEYWEAIVGGSPSVKQAEVLEWLSNDMSVFPHFQHYQGRYKGVTYDSDRPPPWRSPNNVLCRPFADFVRSTLIDRVRNGAVSLLGRVGEVDLPHLNHPLTEEPVELVFPYWTDTKNKGYKNRFIL